MPIDQHLNWLEQSDFSAGLWDTEVTNQLQSAPQAFSLLNDYEPQKEGGLKAYYLGTTITNSGLVSGSTEIPTGIWVRTSTGTVTPGFDEYLATIDSVDFKQRLYRWDAGAGDTNWGVKQTSTAASSAAFQVSSFAEFRISADDTVRVVWTQRGGGGQGNYAVVDASGSVSNLNAYTGPLLVSQARVFYCDGGKIRYSDIGKLSITSTAAQVLTVAPNQPNADIGIISERDPADILVGLMAAPWYEINGDISSATVPVRALGDDHHQRTHIQNVCRVPGGVAFIEPGGRIYKTDGTNFQSLSDAMQRFDIDAGSGSGPGQLAYLNDYLFAPGGRVYDFRTGAWFKTSLLTTSVYQFAVPTGRVYFVNATAGPTIRRMRIYEGGDNTVTRVSSAEFQTVPYADKTGRNVRIREVQIFVKNYSTSSYVAKIIGSKGQALSTHSISARPAGREVLKFMFPNVQDDYLSVYLSAAADNGTSEAPTIERWRIGFGQNNLIGNSAE